jgi:predicted MFS family arabinose efflux permease
MSHAAQGPGHRDHDLWRCGDFLLLWSGQAISTLGSQSSALALPLLVLALTHSAAQAGVVTAVQALPYLVLSLPAGALVDRWDRRAVMIRCDLLRAAALCSLGAAALLGHLAMAHLYAVALVEGSAFVFFNIAEIAALPRVVPPQRLAQASALNTAGDAAAYLLGPALAGGLMGLARTVLAGAGLAYLADGLSYLVSSASLLLVRTRLQARTASRSGVRSLRAEMAVGVAFVWTERRIRTMALMALCLNGLRGPAYLGVIVLAHQCLGTGPGTLGLVLSIAALGGILGAALAPLLTARLRPESAIVAAVAVGVPAVASLAVADTPAALAAGAAALFMALPVFNVAQQAHRLSLIPDTLQGRVNSAFRWLAFGGQPVGAALGGLLLGALGPRAELWVIALGFAACTTFGFVQLRRILRA